LHVLQISTGYFLSLSLSHSLIHSLIHSHLLSLSRRKMQPPDVASAALLFVGITCKINRCDDRISVRFALFFFRTLLIRAFRRRHSPANLAIKWSRKTFFSTIERVVSYKGIERRPLHSLLLPYLSPLFDTQLSVFYGMALFDDPCFPSLS